MSLEEQFMDTAQKWEQKCRLISYPLQCYVLPEYKALVAMGPAILPLIRNRIAELDPGESMVWVHAIPNFAQDFPAYAEQGKDAALIWLDKNIERYVSKSKE